jgi:hypothetical protein
VAQARRARIKGKQRGRLAPRKDERREQTTRRSRKPTGFISCLDLQFENRLFDRHWTHVSLGFRRFPRSGRDGTSSVFEPDFPPPLDGIERGPPPRGFVYLHSAWAIPPRVSEPSYGARGLNGTDAHHRDFSRLETGFAQSEGRQKKREKERLVNKLYPFCSPPPPANS